MNKLDENNIRLEFPYLKESENIIYFDNAATTHKPFSVINALVDFYARKNTNIHRSLHKSSVSATQEYESVRNEIKNFICAKSSKEIIFTSGATEGVNLVAQSYVKKIINAGEIIFVSPIEHHSNIVPWQMLAKETGAILKWLPINVDLQIDVKKLKLVLSEKVKFIATHHVSNITGIIQDVKGLVKEANKFNIPVLVDGAQAVPHVQVDVSDINCDFYCFSGHKVFGPTGTGVLFGKQKLLEECLPYKYGGGMVENVNLFDSNWGNLPYKLEAGTPNVSGVIGLGRAIDFINKHGFDKISAKEELLSQYMKSELRKIVDLVHYGERLSSLPIFSFNIKNLHHYDVATLLGENNILIRSGHLCNQHLMSHLGIEGCLRASLCFYNTTSEIDEFIIILKKIISLLKE